MEFNAINLCYIYIHFTIISETINNVQFSFLWVGVLFLKLLILLMLKLFTIKTICY